MTKNRAQTLLISNITQPTNLDDVSVRRHFPAQKRHAMPRRQAKERKEIEGLEVRGVTVFREGPNQVFSLAYELGLGLLQDVVGVVTAPHL